MKIKDSATVGKDELDWQWGKGDAFAQADLGTPNTDMGTSYTLCIYDDTTAVSALKASIDIPPSPTLWVSKDPKGLQYKTRWGPPKVSRRCSSRPGPPSRRK